MLCCTMMSCEHGRANSIRGRSLVCLHTRAVNELLHFSSSFWFFLSPPKWSCTRPGWKDKEAATSSLKMEIYIYVRGTAASGYRCVWNILTSCSPPPATYIINLDDDSIFHSFKTFLPLDFLHRRQAHHLNHLLQLGDWVYIFICKTHYWKVMKKNLNHFD